MDREQLAAWSVHVGVPFTTSHAHRQGASGRDIDRLVEATVWLRLFKGVFVAAAVWQVADERGRHRLLVAGRLLQKDARWLAARRSAAVFHDLPLLGTTMPQRPQLLRGAEGTRAKAKDRHERVATLLPEEREEIGGVPVTSLARTVHDLARQESFRSALIATDGALRRGLSHDELLALARKRVDWPGGWQALQVAKLANGLHESALESLSWAACHTLGLGMPEPQLRVYLGEQLVARVDGVWRAHNTIGQADGLYKYKDRAGVLADKRQDEALEDLGFEVARWGWDEAFRPAGVLDERLKRAFSRGQRQQVDPRVVLVPTTLEESLLWTGLVAS